MSSRLAGLESVKLIREPVASALGYGVDLEDEQTVLVFDLGGGTLDVSVLEVGGRTNCIEVLATGGDAHLGGDDWDEKIVQWIVAEYLRPKSVSWKSPSMRSNLRMLAEYAKIQLSAVPNVVLKLPVGGGIRGVITQGDIDRMSVDLFRRARLAVDECCWRAGVDLEDVLLKRDRNRGSAKGKVEIRPKNRAPISEVLFVGGATRMPAVRRFVQNMTGLDPTESVVDPDMAVALGAAVQAAALSGEIEDLMLVDVWQASLMRAFADRHLQDEDVRERLESQGGEDLDEGMGQEP